MDRHCNHEKITIGVNGNNTKNGESVTIDDNDNPLAILSIGYTIQRCHQISFEWNNLMPSIYKTLP